MSDASATADRLISEAASPQGRDKAAEEAKSTVSAVAEKAQGAAEDVRRRVGEASTVAREWAVDQSDVLRDTVQTKPFIAVGVSAASAFAAGLVLGVLLARR